MAGIKSSIPLAISAVVIGGLSFFVYDLLFSKPEHLDGKIIEKIFVPARTTSGPTPYGGARRSNYFIKVQQEEQWIAVVKMDAGDTLMVHCMAKHYHTKNVGDKLPFKKYEGKHFHIKYFAHNEEKNQHLNHTSMATYSLNINNQSVTVNADPDTPLLWVLRDELDLKGTKFGCGKSQCGACTVHLNGAAIRSCSLPVAAAVKGKITTIEGLSKDGTHPVQLAWLEIDVPQCGYCQAGQIMSAAALLAKKPQPGDADIDTAMSGNLCRCGTYPRIRRAIKAAAQKGGKS